MIIHFNIFESRITHRGPKIGDWVIFDDTEHFRGILSTKSNYPYKIIHVSNDLIGEYFIIKDEQGENIQVHFNDKNFYIIDEKEAKKLFKTSKFNL